ncbi:MAG: Uncharacterised protein [Synechococcus sp. CC9902]|nr:MAG: Uncharacterised protein [Synechococcus sp. CC9902]
MGQERSLTIRRRKKPMTKLSFLPEVNFNHMTVGRDAFSQDDLQKIQIRLVLQEQNHPGGNESFTTGEHQLQRGDLAADTQGKQLVAAGMVELNRPGFCTIATTEGLPQKLLQLSGVQRGDPIRPDLALK